jgi:hypothetical protein
MAGRSPAEPGEGTLPREDSRSSPATAVANGADDCPNPRPVNGVKVNEPQATTVRSTADTDGLNRPYIDNRNPTDPG